jgi:hypothetical protein
MSKMNIASSSMRAGKARRGGAFADVPIKRERWGAMKPQMLDFFDFHKLLLIFVARGPHGGVESIIRAMLCSFNPQM